MYYLDLNNFSLKNLTTKVMCFNCLNRLNVYVPWNEVVVLDPVKLSRTTETGVLIPDMMTPRKPCKDHDFDYMKPLVLATWKHGFQVIAYVVNIIFHTA